MNYVFFGTPRFAAVILEKLSEAKMPPALVVCNPDKPSGRKQILTAPPAKITAEKYGIPVSQPETLDANFNFDFAVVAAYAKILPKEVIDLFPKGIVGVHPSLLPKYRGTTPIQSAILAGEKETGTTLFLLDEKVDHGPILAQRKLEFPISNFQFSNLLQALAELSGDLLIETLPKFSKGEINPVPQNESGATFTKKFKTEDGFVDLSKENPEMLDRKIRALNPEPGVYTVIDGKRVKILDKKTIQYEGRKPREVGNAIDFLKRGQ